MNKGQTPSIVWFRQDLRLSDQAAYATAASAGPVVAAYILDDEVPGDWSIGGAQRWWLHHSLEALGEDLAAKGVPLVLRRGPASRELAKLANEVGANTVHCLTHYEPWWQAEEQALSEVVIVERHPGYLLSDPNAVRTGSGSLYKIFTPFWRTLQRRMPPPEPQRAPATVQGYDKQLRSAPLKSWRLLPIKPDWSDGFDVWTPGEAGARSRLRSFVDHVGDYDHDRNLPSIEGSSRLSPHLHFGEVSPAAVWHAVSEERRAEPFLRELAWRDFASNLIVQFPAYADDNGRTAFDKMRWRKGSAADADFEAWCEGRTGYPIVDAGMRQLWRSGWMHNRVRMISASFLIKHLLIDWRRGERWFWDCLVDADYSNNSVNWQWVAGTGVDSNPFGRIIAPLTQSPKFNAASYIREWVPELRKLSDHDIHDPHKAGKAPADYPEQLIGHWEGRERALAAAASV